MPEIPFYGEEDSHDELRWRRATLEIPDAADRRHDIALSAGIERARRSYASWRTLLSDTAGCADSVRRRMQAAYACNTRQLIDLDGIKLRLGRHLPLPLAQALLSGCYASAERHLLQSTLEDEDKVMEVGTSIGMIAAFCARRLGSHQVVTFENDPRMVRAARETFALNDVIPQLECCALDVLPGECDVHVDASRHAQPARKPQMPCRSLAQAIAHHRPDVLLIGANGGEHEIAQFAARHKVSRVFLRFSTRAASAAPRLIDRARLAFGRAGYVPVVEATGMHALYRLYDDVTTMTDA